MINPYEHKEAQVIKVSDQGTDIKSFDFKIKDGGLLDYTPGQFFVFSLPGYGESVFVPAEKVGKKNVYDIAVHKLGRVTSRFHQLKTGDTFGIRGPYGNGFDLNKFKGKNILLIAGGIGLVPLRCLLNYYINRNELDLKNRSIQLLYGCRSFGVMIFKDELKKWNRDFDIQISLDEGDHPAGTGMNCYKGVITVLFNKIDIIKNGVAILCGPPVIYKFVVPEVKQVGYNDEDIYLSLERRMHCAGLGTCQHCAVGPYYVCKDGPVFSYAQLKDTVQYF
ncbi:FAD/NAD(P)-binding protein [Patescibacteria group bacterium]|nr:FAD/NAD(P)-binding protein [Patescibacteria group bacterium]MBU0964593.1 FAD/NAD(P)-binding protein [Patescibacteria group bacterium]